MSRILPTLCALLFAATTAKAQFPHERTYTIDVVTVTADGKNREDRAYSIMRNAIARAPYYATRVSEYSAGVYLKGSLDVVKISRLVRGMAGEALKDFKEGENYMQESWNEVTFTAPDRYEQRVVKHLSSMPEDMGNGVEEQAMRMASINIYDIGALGELIASPLSPGTFSHYRFRYEGYTMVGGQIINKIRITPRRRSQQLISGHIFIADDTWDVRGLDLSGSINIIAGVDFNLQTDYGEANGGVWMPSAHRMTFDVGVANSRATMRYMATVDYERLVVNGELQEFDATQSAATGSQSTERKRFSNRDSYRTASRTERRIEASEHRSLDVTEEFADNFKVTVDTLAADPDPEFWDRVRPIALEPAELEGYRDRGVAATTVPDTSAVRRGKSLAGKILTGTKPLKLGERGGELDWSGLIPSRLGFNTVDGFYFGLSPLSYRKAFGTEDKTILTVTPEAIWAINRHVLMGEVAARLQYAPTRRGEAGVSAGSMSRDFNISGGGILPVENTVASLFFRRGYLKLYKDNFVEAHNTIDLASGLALSLSAKYSRRSGLENTSDYSFFYRESRTYIPNFDLADHTAATFTLGAEYTPRQYYRIKDGRKQPVRSSWPTFFASWHKGVRGIFDSAVDFDHISLGLLQNLSPGRGQWLQYYVRGGGFVNKRSLYFPDCRHFNASDIPLVNSSIATGAAFRLLPYYRYSTSESYFQAHIGYQARFLVLKLLPWFSNRLWMEGVQLNYLTTPVLRNYAELGYTIGLLWQAGVFVGFEGLKYRSFGVKLSLPISVNRQSASVSL